MDPSCTGLTKPYMGHKEVAFNDLLKAGLASYPGLRDAIPPGKVSTKMRMAFMTNKIIYYLECTEQLNRHDYSRITVPTRHTGVVTAMSSVSIIKTLSSM